MITLEDWFTKKSKKPLLIAAGFIVIVQCCLISFVLYQNNNAQLNGINKVVANIATLGIEQSNRNLIESATETAIEQFGVNTVLICKGSETDFSFPSTSIRCDNLKTESLFESLVKIQPSGFEKYQMYFYVNRLHGTAPFIWMAFFSFLFILIVLFILFRVQSSFKNEIISPIENQLLSDKTIGIIELESLRKSILDNVSAVEANAKASVIMNHKKSLSHNIRSKVQTLQGVYKSIEGSISENDRAVMKSLIKSFLSMTDKLSHYVSKETRQEYFTEETFFEAMKASNEQKALIDVASLLRSSVELKNKELSSLNKSHIKIRAMVENEHVFSILPELELYSIVSNILNNSIEADCTKVDLKLSATDGFIQIDIHDNGSGVPEELKPSLFNFGETQGKKEGTGYGLFHAREFLRSWGGSIDLLDPDKRGTKFEIKIPLWTIPKMQLNLAKTIAVLDDDEIVHQNWNKRLSNQPNTELKSFTDSTAFSSWITSSEVIFDGLTCLIDNDLGYEQSSGSELIKSLGIKDISSLVTNRYDDPSLVSYCHKYEINLIPKPIIPMLLKINSN